jgi:allophanate hydrolase
MRLDLNSLQSGYRSGAFTPVDVIREVYARIQAFGDMPVWIHQVPEAESLERAESLNRLHEDLPLYGVPFAIKDNIDLANVPTTAGCPAFAYTPSKSAFTVERLVAAGAIPIGKTNLDQFATGLVGTRSPYGACSSVFDDRYISGGSSSGSAVAVASGMVSFSLGTDTAGSGRVPAAFNNIVGLKPTRGALSASGVVPACRTLDCVSIFALTCQDAAQVMNVAGAYDAADGYSRPVAQQRAWPYRGFRFGVPARELLKFFGDEQARTVFEAASATLQDLGGCPIEFDYSIFSDAAQLLYSGPWVAERLAAIQEFAAVHPDALYPVTGKIILAAAKLSAVDAFQAAYRLANLASAAGREWEKMDFMLLPTAGRHYTHEEVTAEPIAFNTNLGYYTNFVNLLDLAAIAVPCGWRSNGMPFGVTLIGPAWSDAALARIAGRLHRASPNASSGKGLLGQVELTVQDCPTDCPSGYVPLAVCGAHLTGQPLNRQLIDAGGFLLESCRTSQDYRLYALKGTVPAKPGLVLSRGKGAAIELEVWAIPESSFGAFVAAVPPPLAIGTCSLSGGRKVKSFVCEPCALEGAEDITHFGGWRAWLARKQASN